MARIIVASFCAVAVTAAQEQPIPQIAIRPSVFGDDGAQGNTRAATSYDNWTNPPSALLGTFRIGGDEVADDLQMISGGKLSAIGISIANTGTSGTVSVCTIVTRFYDAADQSLLGAFQFQTQQLGIGPGSSLRFSFAEGDLSDLNIVLPAHILLSLQFTAITGGAQLSAVGMQVRGPVGIGASEDQLLDLTTNTTFNFGGSPLANAGFFVKTDEVPEPATLATIAVGGLALLLRRGEQTGFGTRPARPCVR